jgi:DNA polymerase-3 subunit alpha
VYVAGVIYGVVVRNSRRGRMAVLTLDDGTARVEIVVFGELFQEKRAVIQEDQVVVIQGRASMDDFSGGMRITADKLMDLAELRAAYARVLRLSIRGREAGVDGRGREAPADGQNHADTARLKSLLAQYAGGQCQVAIRYRNDKGECDIRLPESCRVKVSAPLLDSLSAWLDERNVEVVY